MSEEARAILWFGVEDTAVIRRRTLAGLFEFRAVAGQIDGLGGSKQREPLRA
jgi:hypothetical protein